MRYRQNRIVWTPGVAERDIDESIRRGTRGTPYNTVQTVTASATAADYNVILCDCTGGAITISLPRAVDYNGSYTIKKIDASVNAITIDPAGSETVDGATTLSFSTQWESHTLVSNNSVWYII